MSKSNSWGKGWDYLLKEIWPNLDRVRKDNLAKKHDHKNIDYCFGYLYGILVNEVLSKIKTAPWNNEDKLDLLAQTHDLINEFKSSKTYNEKVISINMAEQFIRSIY